MTSITLRGLNDEHLKVIIKALRSVYGGDKVEIIPLDEITSEPLRKRLNLISTLLIEKCIGEEGITLENTYRAARKKGYPRTRRTFQRDIDRLEKKRMLIRDVKIGGPYGTTTLLRLTGPGPKISSESQPQPASSAHPSKAVDRETCARRAQDGPNT
jgi:hypothetical protein